MLEMHLTEQALVLNLNWKSSSRDHLTQTFISATTSCLGPPRE